MQIDGLSHTLCMHTHFVSYKHTLPHSHATQTVPSPADLLLCLYVLHFSLQTRAHTPQMITSVHLVAFSTLANLCLVSYLPVSDKTSILLAGLSLFSLRLQGLAVAQCVAVGITCMVVVLICTHPWPHTF